MMNEKPRKAIYIPWMVGPFIVVVKTGKPIPKEKLISAIRRWQCPTMWENLLSAIDSFDESGRRHNETVGQYGFAPGQEVIDHLMVSKKRIDEKWRSINNSCGQIGEIKATVRVVAPKLMRLVPSLPVWGKPKQDQFELADMMTELEGELSVVLPSIDYDAAVEAFVEPPEDEVVTQIQQWPPDFSKWLNRPLKVESEPEKLPEPQGLIPPNTLAWGGMTTELSNPAFNLLRAMWDHQNTPSRSRDLVELHREAWGGVHDHVIHTTKDSVIGAIKGACTDANFALGVVMYSKKLSVRGDYLKWIEK